MPRSSLIELLDLFDRHGGGAAYGHRRGYRMERWSYRQVADVARQFARELESRRIQAGQRVILWGENSAEWVASFLGCMLCGVVVVPMDRIAAPEFAWRVARDVDAKLMICSRELAPAMESERSRHDAPFPLATLLLEELAELLPRHSHAPFASPPLGRSDLLQIVFTSGTTAEPRGVAITHGNVLANLEPLEKEIAAYLKYERLVHPLRFLNLLPLSHVFGQFLGIFVPPLLGATVFFQDSLNPSEVIRAVRQERISVMVAVPRMLESLRAKIERDAEAGSGGVSFPEEFAAAATDRHFAFRWWRFRKIHQQFGWKFWAFISGGAALDADTEEFWRRLGFVVIQGYGLTETTSLISVNHPFRLGKGSIGKVLPGREMKLDPNGEILVRGENVASGYWQGGRLETVERTGDDNWFRTGDVGQLDAGGNLYFKGRQKNVIVTPEGMNVYPEDLEKALRLAPEVRDVVVVPLEREKNAEACAVLLLRGATHRQTAAALIQRTNQTLGEHQKIRHWLVWPEEDFPRTSTQKPRTNLILERVRAQAANDAKLDTAAQGSLAELIARVTGRAPQSFRSGAGLAAELNLNSLERVELMSALEDRYQVDLDENLFTTAVTVGQLEELVHRPAASPSRYSYPRWTQHPLQRAARVGIYYLFVWPATQLLAHPRVRGRERLAGLSGPALFVSNHITEIDIGFILAALPVRFRHRLAVAMIGERLHAMKHPPANMNMIRSSIQRLNYFLVVALFNVFPLPQAAGFRESFSFAGESADRGYSVLVFPEGRRTADGRLSPFRAGIGVLARRLNLPIVPVRIDGLYDVKQTGRKFARPGAVRVSIGDPARFSAEATPEEITRDLEERIKKLEWPV
ncbi:MAG: AMP-binding protein [Acidipila sp.]|nr:AMP-binding protein [Acidipila sp.]